MTLKLERLTVPAGRRILAASDIHGDWAALQSLLEQAAFSEKDELVLLGDYIEKGEGNLPCLRNIMKLSERPNVHLLMGNCDTVWEDVLTDGDYHTLEYMLRRKKSILNEMCREAGFAVTPETDVAQMKRVLRSAFREELSFLAGLPHILDIGNFLFVHGGIPSEGPDGLDGWEVMKNDYFYNQDVAFSRYVVVGHMPTVNYFREIGSMNPIVDSCRRIICIDGGNVLRQGGQLNLFIIPDRDSEDFSFLAFDGLPKAVVRSPQAASENPSRVVWAENELEMLQAGEDLSLCRQLSSGREYWIGNDELFRHPDGSLHCGEANDYLLPLSRGDTVSVAARYRERSLCKKGGVIGWAMNENLEFETPVS